MTRRAMVIVMLAACLCGCGKEPQTEQEWLKYEQAQHDKVIKSLRGRTYRTVRGNLPASVWNLGAKAAAAAPPNNSEIAGMLAGFYLVAGRDRMALYELAMVDESELDAQGVQLVTLMRGYAYASSGWARLANAELAALTPPTDADSASQMQLLIHYGVVAIRAYNNDFDGAAEAAMNAGNAFADDPLGQLLIGMAQTHYGEYEKAADAFERAIELGDFDPQDTAALREMAAKLREAESPWRLFITESMKMLAGMKTDATTSIRSKYEQVADHIAQIGRRIMQAMPTSEEEQQPDESPDEPPADDAEPV